MYNLLDILFIVYYILYILYCILFLPCIYTWYTNNCNGLTSVTYIIDIVSYRVYIATHWCLMMFVYSDVRGYGHTESHNSASMEYIYIFQLRKSCSWLWQLQEVTCFAPLSCGRARSKKCRWCLPCRAKSRCVRCETKRLCHSYP